jgi:hypothetical protein
LTVSVFSQHIYQRQFARAYKYTSVALSISLAHCQHSEIFLLAREISIICIYSRHTLKKLQKIKSTIFSTPCAHTRARDSCFVALALPSKWCNQRQKQVWRAVLILFFMQFKSLRLHQVGHEIKLAHALATLIFFTHTYSQRASARAQQFEKSCAAILFVKLVSVRKPVRPRAALSHGAKFQPGTFRRQ